jgi:hypothetical protein
MHDGQIALFDATGYLARKLLGLPGNPAGDFQSLDVRLLHLLPALLRLVSAGASNCQNLQLGGPAAVAHLRAYLARHRSDSTPRPSSSARKASSTPTFNREAKTQEDTADSASRTSPRS